MAGAELGFETNTCTIISASCPFRHTCCAGRFARTPGAALLFLHRGAKSAISASAISTGLGSSGVKNRSPSSLSPFPTRSYRVSKPFWSAMPSTCPCCSAPRNYSTPIASAPSPPSMHLMNPGTSMAPRSATLPPLASGGGRYEPNESPSYLFCSKCIESTTHK